MRTIRKLGFTIVELAAVIVVMAILASIVIVSYSKLEEKANDNSSLSALDAIEGIVENYSQSNSLEDAHYYSGTPADVEALGYKPNDKTVVDVVTDSIDFCIRAYNPGGTKDSIYNAFIRESTPGVCGVLAPSTTASVDYRGDKVWVSVSSNVRHTCAIDSDGMVYCWGLNDGGQLGDGTSIDKNIPTPVDMSGVLAGKRAEKITTGYWHTCIVADDGLPYCWGLNAFGQLGDGTGNYNARPVAVDVSGVLSGKTIKQIESSWGRVCVVASDNMPYCWGNAEYGSLGWQGWSGSNSFAPVPVYMGGVLSGKTVKRITTPGNYHGCLIASDSRLYCWGQNNEGQLGVGDNINKNTPVAVDTSGVLKNKRIIDATTNNRSTCAVASDSTVYCWGKNDFGQLANGTFGVSTNLPEVVNSGAMAGKNIVGFSTGSDNSICTLSIDSKVYCWGSNIYYQLGIDDNVNKNIPVDSVNINDILPVYTNVGALGGCAMTANYKLYCWGAGDVGRIGNGSNDNALKPVVIDVVN